MKKFFRLSVFLLLTMIPNQLFAKTLDHYMSPGSLARELGLPSAAATINAENPLTPEEVKAKYGVDVFAEFPVVIIINKSDTGPSAQTLTVYHDAAVVGTFKTSTGREDWEDAPNGDHYFTETPVGWFRPQFFVKDHFSSIWHARMELSIFFNAGIAIHATTPDLYDQLGTRASGGCVRLTHEDAQTVWDLTYTLPQKVVPVFNTDGTLKTDAAGNVVRAPGSGVLILVLDLKT